MFKKILKFLLIVIVWLLIGVVLVGGCILLGYPGEFGLYVFIGLLALWYGIKLVRLLYRRHQAAKRVKHLINVESTTAEQTETRRKPWQWRQRGPLENSFRGLIKTLDTTDLSRRGDPLYVLPWMALLGDAPLGLKEWIRGARLARPAMDFTSLDNATGIHWHLNNQSLVISTPSDLVEGNPDSSDPRWLELLSLLVRYRRVEPLNGLMVALPAQMLLHADTEHLMDRARKIRRLIEDSIQVSRRQVPVYVLITGLEQLEGVPDWLSSLDDAALNQAVGQLNARNDAPEVLVDAVIDALANRIRGMNLAAVSHPGLAPDLMRLPARVRGLSPALQTLVSTLFQENPYQQTPRLRGLYLTAMTERRGHVISAFSHDVLERILPADRDQVEAVAVTRRRSQWHERRRPLALAGAAGVLFFALTALYLNDRQALERLHDSQQVLQASNDAGAEGAIEASLRQRQQELRLIRALQGQRFVPWLFGSEQAVITGMQARFSSKVQQALIAPIDDAFLETLNTDFFSTAFDASDRAMLDAVGAYTGILVRRINLLNAYMEGASAEALQAMPMPYDPGEVQAVSRQLLEVINELYLQSLVWRDRDDAQDGELTAITAQRNDMVSTLDRILTHSGGSLAWIVDWLNGNPNYPGIDLADQWGAGSGSLQDDVQVAGAFTLAGKEAIESYLLELQQASPDSEAIDKMLPRFFREYRLDYLNAWESYALAFQQGLSRLASPEDYLLYINNLNTGRNQYFNALDLVYAQTAPLLDAFDEDNAEGETLPDWLLMVDYYNDMISLSPDEGTDNSARDKTLTKLALKTVGATGPLGKALAKSGKKGLKTKKKLDKASGGPTASERLLRLEEAAGLLEQYRDALSDFVFNAERRSVSYRLMRNQFQNADNPGGGEGSLATAQRVLRELQALVGKPNRDNQAFWTLFAGPIELIEAYAIEEASCQFNAAYRNAFLASLEGVPEYRKPDYTYGPEGVLWSFMDNEAAPFVTRQLGAGYVKVSADGRQLPLDPAFLRYTAKALDQRNASPDAMVDISTKPTETNLDALYGVSETRLQLQCPSGTTVLVNRNFANSETFNWNQACADTRLNLAIGAVELEKTYSGPAGFPEFLADFRSGSLRFTPEDFPRHEQQLREYGVSFIRVQYDLAGYQALLRRFDVRPSEPPANASACWDRGR